MKNAIDAYLAAATPTEIEAAYAALVETYAADPDLPDDADFESGVDAMLNNMGLPSLTQRLNEKE